MSELKIGNLSPRIPVIQGGMGVGVSLSNLAGAVAAAGGIGVISTAQIGFRNPDFARNPIECNLKAIREEIEKARAKADGGIVGVNIMVATRRYEDYVKAAAAAGADLIISGAGLPMTLPELAGDAKIAPIVSSRKALRVIANHWRKKYDRKPDLVVVEGPLAGGHLGFSREDIDAFTVTGEKDYDEEIASII
ncbi:MAG: nitronate monooxygenase, partial [Lachnospiraceae bacterium]|nr:nitronate monooxygenase [Lachnospiraceae bacterium]